MADLETIRIPVDSTGMVRAVKDAKALENSIKLLTTALNSGAIGSNQYNKGLLQLKRQYEGLFKSSQQATAQVRGHAKSLQESKAAAEASARAEEQLLAAKRKAETAYALGMQRAREEAAQLSKTQAEMLRLESMYNKVSTAARVYQQAQESLNRAVQLGVIADDQKEAKLLELSTAYQKVGNDAGKAQRFIDQFGENAQVTGRGLNQFGMVTQQVGYQVGDFFVQIQSGTNALVAFGQQATQLAGLVPGILGAALGIGISLITALGAAFMRSSGEAKTLAQSLSDLEAAVNRVNEVSNAYSSEGLQTLMDKYGELDAQVLSLVENQTRYANILASSELKNSIKAIQEAVGGSLFDIGISEQASSLLNLQKIFKTTANDAKALRYAFDEVAKAKTYEEQSVALARVADYLGIVLSKQEDVTQEQLDIYNAVLSSLDAVEQLSNNQPKQGWLTAAIAQAQNLATALWDAAAARVAAVPESGPGMTTGNLDWAKTNLGFTLAGDELLGLPKVKEAAKGAAKGLNEATKAAEELRRELDEPLVSAVGSISDAFGDFVARGLKDFKGFVQQILGSFKNMIAQMIAMAVKNRIMLSLGVGGLTPGMAAAGQIAGLGSAGGMMGSLGIGSGIAGLAGGTGFLGGMGNAVAGLAGGGAGFLGIGGNAALAGGGALATIGAAIPVIGAVAAAFSFFKKKTKELDAGLRITVTNMDALVKSFQTIQTKRFWGLSKKTSTTESEVTAEISDPIVEAVQKMQTQIVKAAELFGISSDAFDNFVYDFEVSLKGLTEEQKIQKVNEEILKMGDAFTALSGQFTSMNQLLVAAQERYDLTTRLLQAQGKEEELLTRQRELELAAVQDVNKELLLQVQAQEEANRIAEQTREIERQALAAAEEAARLAAKISEDKAQIEIKLLEAQGKAAEALAAQRATELAALDETNRALLQQVFDQQDLNKAQEEANRVAEEAKNLQKRRQRLS